MKTVIIFDFDDTICACGWPDISEGTLIHDAKQAILFAKQLGCTIIINTCREGEKLEDALQFLKQHDIPWDYANENDPERIEFFGGDSRKISGDLVIDDKNAGGINWKEVPYEISVTYSKNELMNDSSFQEVINCIEKAYEKVYGGRQDGWI